jgi:hypothetical protein
MVRGNFHLTELTNQKTRNTMSKQIELKFSKETKGTFVYKSMDKDSLITNLYLMKSQMPAEVPKRVTVTVEFE